MKVNKCLRHIALIPDGNGRWATSRFKSRMQGHKQGASVFKSILAAALKLPELEVMTFFLFSLENGRRPGKEVSFLMSLMSNHIDGILDDLMEHNIRFEMIGDRSLCDPALLKKIDYVVKKTEKNTRLTLVCALHYSGRWDILQAAQATVAEFKKQTCSDDEITDSAFSKHLSMAHHPDPDLLIRTSGEQRISNFMLWDMAYTEFYFEPKLWPDYTPADFNQAINCYYKRERRFGALVHSPEEV